MSFFEETMQCRDIMNAMLYMVNNREFDRLLSLANRSERKLIKHDKDYLNEVVKSNQLNEQSTAVIINSLQSAEVLKRLLIYAIKEEQNLNNTIILHP